MRGPEAINPQRGKVPHDAGVEANRLAEHLYTTVSKHNPYVALQALSIAMANSIVHTAPSRELVAASLETMRQLVTQHAKRVTLEVYGK